MKLEAQVWGDQDQCIECGTLSLGPQKIKIKMNTNLNIFGAYKFIIELSVTLVLTLANWDSRRKLIYPILF